MRSRSSCRIQLKTHQVNKIRKKSKAVSKKLQKKSAFLHKISVVANWLSSFYRHPNNYFYHNKKIGRRVDILYSKFMHPPIAQLVERRTVEVQVNLRSLVRVRVGGELFDILYLSNNEIKLYKSDDFVHFIWKQTSDFKRWFYSATGNQKSCDWTCRQDYHAVFS